MQRPGKAVDMRAVTLTLAAIPVVFGGLGVALVAGGFDPFDTFAPTIDEAPLSPPTGSDPTSQVSDPGTPIDGRRPHLDVVDGHAPLELPASLPALLSLLPPTATELAPLPAPATPAPAPAHGDAPGGSGYDTHDESPTGDGPSSHVPAALDTADRRDAPAAEPGPDALPVPGVRSLPLPSPDESETQPSASDPLPPRANTTPRPDRDKLSVLADGPTDQAATQPKSEPALVPTIAPPSTGQDEPEDPPAPGDQSDRTLTSTRAPEGPADTDPGAPPGTEPDPR